MSNTNDIDSTTLSAEEREILAHWMKQERQARLIAQQIKPRQAAGDPPLSFAQERLWFLHQLEPDSTAYNMRLALRLKGKLRVDALLASLNRIVDRHEALRTHFPAHQGKPIQVIDEATFELPQEDLSALPSETLEREVKTRVDEEALQPFDLGKGPLLRGSLLRLSDQEHVLLLTMHHIIYDGWSLEILFRELGECYAALSEGKQPELAELPIQYADFAVWQRQWLSGKQLDRQLDYWSKQLADLVVLNLPTDRIRPAMHTYDGAVEGLFIDKRLSERLERLSHDSGVTLFITLLAVYLVMLHRYSGQDDIVIGTPIANRNRSELEGLIGFFVNMLALRIDCSGNPDYKTLVKRVSEVALGAYEHQDIPFERLVDVLQVERDPSRNPLFQVTFSLQNASMDALELQGLTLEPVDNDARKARFDLECYCWKREGGFEIKFLYNTNLFEASTIQRMLGHYYNLLENVVCNPELPVKTISILSPAEKNRILVEWNDTKVFYDEDPCVHELFEAQVEKSPHSLAVNFCGETLTYRDLNERSNQLAHHLLNMGVGKEAIVGIYMDRSADMIVAVLGVLKAGCAYLPMDPVYPQERLSFMQEDSRVAAVLTQAIYLETVPIKIDRIVCMDADSEQISQESKNNLRCAVDPNNLAYIVYTSGTTGKPKGVLVFHRAIINLLNSMIVELGITEHDIVFSVNALSFDIIVLDFYLPLVSGASIVLADPEIMYDGRKLLANLQNSGATFMDATPATWRMLVDAGWEEKLPLRIFCGGEALPRKLADQLLDRCDVFWNAYGPSETTVCTSLTRLESKATPVSIGKPIANTQMYILDPNLQPVPVGVPGELHIGGACMTGGYLNRAELTEEKFIPNPFSDQPESKLYKTGDLVRYFPDGNIEFIRRVDNQVKIRGYRIELGEIQTVLSQHEFIKDCAVLVYEDLQGNKNIAAYFVSDSSISTLSLRNNLRKKLPHYMIPTLLTKLEEIPVAPNGKTDYKTLASYTKGKTISDSKYIPPETPAEKKIAGIWEAILNVDRIGVGDNFFDLGGHSLMATQVVSRIRGQLNVELPLSEMFSYPTVAELAPVVESLLNGRGEEVADVIPVADREGGLPLSFAQERLWFLDQLDPGGSAYNMPLALRLEGDLSVAALKKSINAIVARQQGLRTRFSMHDGKPYQVIEDRTIELERDDLSTLPSERLQDEVKKKIDAEALQPFDLSTGPLLRCRLLRLSGREHVLLLTMHHVISDGWSLGVLFRELGACYEAFSRGEQPVLAELPIQYADFAVWQRDWLSGEVLASQMAYWREKLEDLSPLKLPTDRPRPAVQTYTGSSEKIALDSELSKRLKSLSRQAGVTLFMTLLAGFAVLMHRYSGQEDIVVGTPIANRNRSELEDLIGIFVNSLVMRTDVSGNPGFRELVQRVNRTTLEAYEHQDLPFEKLVDEIQTERDLSHNPLFQVMFALQNAPVGSLGLKGLTLESISREVKVSGFDLECHVLEKGDRLEVVFVYNTDLFDASTIRRMMTHYRLLLEASIASPETPVGELEILNDEEKQLILHQWNQTRADFVENETLHSLFEKQVQRTPQATAVRFEQQSLDYAELERKANDFAVLLQAKNVEPGQLVGIYLERSIGLVVALLGILKAGAAYVPLDPEYPEEHINYIVDDSNIRVLISQEKFEKQLPSKVTNIIYLDSDKLYENVKPQTLPVVTEDALAYVIYTSGSTGKPKGVMVSHGAVVNHAFWMCDLFGIDETDRLLQKSPISFDASVCEIFVPLLSGACVVLSVPGGDRDIDYLIQEIQDNKITALILVPSALRILLQNLPDPAALSSLKRMGCGGEALTQDLKQAYYKKCSAPLYNLYGPTESTIDATSFLCEEDFDQYNIPIGYPVSNKQAYILDRRLQPVPIGVLGELHIGGAGLSRGYLNQAELTAEKFVADPFSDDPQARLYKTGDLARYREDGSIEYIGRIDHQVKVRGFRIELGEIETVLSQHDLVKDCAAMLFEDHQGHKNIAAYFVSESSISTLSLRNYLRKKLPQYMIPTLLTKLDEIPVSPNGKIDYKTLASYTEGKTVRDSVYHPPETPAEEKIAGIWETLLNVDRVGVGDNFFDIGGHSLLLIQARSAIEKEVGVTVPVADFFHQTLSQIATYCENNQTPEMSIEEV